MTIEPGTLLLYDGDLARVIGVGEGVHVTLELIEAPPCPTCGPRRLHLLAHAPLFTEHVAPVPTLGARLAR